MSLINEQQVILGLTADDRHAATRALAETLVATGRCTDLDQFVADVRKREETMATGLPGGIAIPHARSAAITEPTLAFGRPAEGIDWGAKDGPATVVFLIAAPEGASEAHMQVLPRLAKALMKKEFKAALAEATSEDEVVAIVEAEVGEAPVATPAPTPTPAPAAAAAATEPAEAPAASSGLTLVGVTSCPTGIAHTYMAAEALERAAKEAGHTMVVETQGSAGATPLSAAQIAEADAVIFAHDVEVRNADRFAGKPIIDVGVKKAISDGPLLISQAVDKAAEWKADPSKAAAAPAATGSLATKVDEKAGIGTRIRQWLMTGVSYMIPFVAAGGILIALSFLVANQVIEENAQQEIVSYYVGFVDPAVSSAADYTPDPYNLAASFDATSMVYWAALMFVIGGAAFGFLVPILSGFIAFAIADRPGLVPGIVGGFIANTMGAGFLGGIVTGVLGGFAAKWISSWKVHKGVRGVMPVVVTPLLSLLITAGLFITLLGKPIVAAATGLTEWLNGIPPEQALILGAILGAMMGFDLGGPVNKVAYFFATAGLASAGAVSGSTELKVMAAVMAAGMVAPLAMALATVVRPKLFSEPERENGKAAWLLGASFISEGAIPFAAADPWRVILSSVIGSSVTGALALAWGTESPAPHGGVWVAALITHWWLWIAAIVIGVVVMTSIVLILKSRDPKLATVDAAATV
ncbi:PTS fructose transporter subunit IIABC [Demequina lignilytica]|uniref:Fructose-specific PTS transporter subunit EIIC n=1 Tax=Demequina lignilytica TaxID=3051663 RepID=A0AB35MIP7_9MICO|nr:fructose-specific PTS transporter subunit EIIC [Demequina sp. SYSU T0a273]MDN4483653.1 fructose-specific PTS transporter subunit EIIC [Demequina sp. SYSU T0a273]